VPQSPHARGVPVHTGSAAVSPDAEAKTDSFFSSFVEPQWGHGVPSQRVERTNTSLSRSQSAQ
jgi:hypothetical protein